MSLSGNTAKITELIAKINALPEAGSGGGSGGGAIEPCTVTYDDGSLWINVAYTKANGELAYLNNEGLGNSSFTITDVAKGSYIYVVVGDTIDFACDNAELSLHIDWDYESYIFKITGNATIYG